MFGALFTLSLSSVTPIACKRAVDRGSVGDLAPRRTAELAQVEDLQNGAAGVDEGAVERVHIRGHLAPYLRAGEAGDGCIAGADDGGTLRVRRKWQEQRRAGERHSQK
jgi:hypothetical protein